MFSQSWYFFFFQLAWLPELVFLSEDQALLEDMLADAGLHRQSEEVWKNISHWREMFLWFVLILLSEAE